MLVRDLDGDGAPEIIASGNQVEELGAFSLLANRGDGTFAAERPLASGFGERLEDAGDVDGDGIPDLLASSYWSNGIAVYRGRGSLQFDSRAPYDTATHGGPSRIVDYDRDGKPDLVSLSFGSGNPVRVHLFRGQADGTLAAKVTFDTSLANGISLSTRTIGGALEMLVAEHSGRLGLLRYMDGRLTVSTIDSGPGFDRTCAFADVNGDGIADIIDTTDEEDALEAIFVTLGKADGTFLDRKRIAQPRHVAFPVVLRAGDFDGDGRADLVVSDFRATSLYWFRGDGRGSFAEAVAIDAGGPVNDLAVGDVNGDGRLDLATVNDDHSASVLINGEPCRQTRRRALRP